MFKRSAGFLGRCTQDCLRGRWMQPNLMRSLHVANIQETFTTNTETKKSYLKVVANFKNKGIYQERSSQRDGHANPTPRKLEDGVIGVIQVQENVSADLSNPMVRRFLHDLELQQKKRIQDDRGGLTKQITMSAGDGDNEKMCKEMALKKKCEKEELKRKCRELAARDKCAKAKKDKSKNKGGATKKKGASKKKSKKEEAAAKKCKELKEKEQCRQLAMKDKEKADRKKCKKLAMKDKKKAKKAKSKKLADEEKCKKK